jgi:hypothetical protein
MFFASRPGADDMVYTATATVFDATPSEIHCRLDPDIYNDTYMIAVRDLDRPLLRTMRHIKIDIVLEIDSCASQDENWGAWTHIIVRTIRVLRRRLLANKLGQTLEIRVEYEQVRSNWLGEKDLWHRRTAGFKHIWAALEVGNIHDQKHNGIRGTLGAFEVKIRNGLFTEAIRNPMTEEEVCSNVHAHLDQVYPNMEEIYPLPCLVHDREWNDIGI